MFVQDAMVPPIVAWLRDRFEASWRTVGKKNQETTSPNGVIFSRTKRSTRILTHDSVASKPFTAKKKCDATTPSKKNSPATLTAREK